MQDEEETVKVNGEVESETSGNKEESKTSEETTNGDHDQPAANVDGETTDTITEG